jgi:hypothetical protein
LPSLTLLHPSSIGGTCGLHPSSVGGARGAT